MTDYDKATVTNASGGAIVLTVREILALPLFAPARLIAGEAGLENAVNWVHVVDIPRWVPCISIQFQIWA